jgi:hypothetical protein
LLGALVKMLEMVDDAYAIAQVQHRWIKRKRPKRLIALASMLKQEESPETQRKLRMQELGKRGGKIGGKRRMKTMSKRARQRVATHAARVMWFKRTGITP